MAGAGRAILLPAGAVLLPLVEQGQQKTASTGEAGEIRLQVEETHKLAEQKQHDMVQMLGGIAQTLGAKLEDPGAKSIESMVNKVQRKRESGQSDYGVLSMKDHARAALLLQDLSQVPETIQKLKEHFPNLTGEVFLETPLNRSGYRGIHLTIDLGDGIRGEIQLSTPQAWAIKKETDAIYEKWRNISRKSMTQEQRED